MHEGNWAMLTWFNLIQSNPIAEEKGKKKVRKKVMMRSCLFVIDGMKAAKLGAYLYYLLEDNGVTVNFASAAYICDCLLL